MTGLWAGDLAEDLWSGDGELDPGLIGGDGDDGGWGWFMNTEAADDVGGGKELLVLLVGDGGPWPPCPGAELKDGPPTAEPGNPGNDMGGAPGGVPFCCMAAAAAACL